MTNFQLRRNGDRAPKGYFDYFFHRCRLLTCLAALALAGFCLPTFAQELEFNISIPSTPTPIGSGARAAGMADAFVAIADDATAASWNPAGLVQLEAPELSIVGDWNQVVDDFDASPFNQEVDGMHDVQNLGLNYLSFVYPLPVLVMDRNVTVSLNYQQKFDFTRKFSTRKNQSAILGGGLGTFHLFERLDFEQSGGLSTVSPALAFELTRRISFGASLNLWRSTPFNDNSWTQSIRDTQSATLFGTYELGFLRRKEYYRNFRGENLTLGLLWDVNDQFKIGMRYDTAFSGTVDYERRGRIFQTNVSPAFSLLNKREKQEVRFPDSLALGVSYRPNDRLTFSMDVTRTDWNEFTARDGDGVRRSLVDASNVDDRNASTDMDATYTVRLGSEYIFVPRFPTDKLDKLWTVRGGLFYDEEPATGKRDRNGRGNGDADKFYGFALGFGVQLHQRVNIDMAYQYRMGRGVNVDFLRGVPEFEVDVDQHRVLLSTVIYFK